jgi:hypothetical protein
LPPGKGQIERRFEAPSLAVAPLDAIFFPLGEKAT